MKITSKNHMNKQKQMSKKKRDMVNCKNQFLKKGRNEKDKPKSRMSMKKQEHHFSKKTGTQSRNHINHKDLLKNKLHRKVIEKNSNPFIKYIEEKETKPKIKLTQNCLFNLMRKDLEDGFSYNDKYKTIIDKGKNDDIILELNKESIRKQKIRVRILALSLLRTELPNDINKQIISYGLNGIYLETNIYKLLPDLVLKTIYEIEEELHNKYAKLEVFNEYRETKPNFYKLLEKMFYRRYFDSYVGMIYQDIRYNHGINNFTIIYNNI
jgi:hypothetical protein